MNSRIYGKLVLLVVLILVMSVAAGCGNSGDDGLSMKDIPRYPNATEQQSMQHSSPGGVMGGKLVQFTTTDSFDKVVAFYTDALNSYNPEFLSHTSALGRQTAISILQKNETISIAVQEFVQEERLNITFMAVGS